jgi:hypothetical protein
VAGNLKKVIAIFRYIILNEEVRMQNEEVENTTFYILHSAFCILRS